MPNKYSDKNRHKFKKTKYKVTNWPDYNKELRNRSDFCIWFNEDVIANWCEPKENYSGIGRPKKYSEVAVQTTLFLRQLFHLPLRQTQGWMDSIINLMELPIKMMDYTNISKRSNGLNFERLIDDVKAGSHVIVDSLTDPLIYV